MMDSNIYFIAKVLSAYRYQSPIITRHTNKIHAYEAYVHEVHANEVHIYGYIPMKYAA